MTASFRTPLPYKSHSTGSRDRLRRPRWSVTAFAKPSVVAIALLAAAMLALTRIDSAWQLLLWAAAAGIGVGCLALAMGATIANRWFVTQRGLVIGMFSAGNATGQLVFFPMFGVLIDHGGWRNSAIVLAAVALALIPLRMVFVTRASGRRRNSALGRRRNRARTDAQTQSTARSISVCSSSATRSRTFWLLAGSFFICGASTNGLIGTHLVPACGDHGIPETHAAGLLAAMGLFDLSARLHPAGFRIVLTRAGCSFGITDCADSR